MTNPSNKEFATANLTLASYLSHLDWPYRLVRGEGKSATWHFTGINVEAQASAFSKGKATVEPQAFHHSITRTRKLLFEFINCGDGEWSAEQVQEKLG
jgi:hypothetical protein